MFLNILSDPILMFLKIFGVCSNNVNGGEATVNGEVVYSVYVGSSACLCFLNVSYNCWLNRTSYFLYTSLLLQNCVYVIFNLSVANFFEIQSCKTWARKCYPNQFNLLVRHLSTWSCIRCNSNKDLFVLKVGVPRACDDEVSRGFIGCS